MQIQRNRTTPAAQGSSTQNAARKPKADTYSARGASFVTVKGLLKGAFLALAVPGVDASGSGKSNSGNVCAGYPLNIQGDSAPPGDGDTSDNSQYTPATVTFFTGNNSLEGQVIANMQTESGTKSDELDQSAAQLSQNMMCIIASQCGLTQSSAPNNASKRIPGYLESTYVVAVNVNRFNDSNGLDPQVKCIFNLGFK
jgi:hypothetical protein